MRLRQPRLRSRNSPQVCKGLLPPFIAVDDAEKRDPGLKPGREFSNSLKNPVVLRLQRHISFEMHSTENAVDRRRTRIVQMLYCPHRSSASFKECRCQGVMQDAGQETLTISRQHN